MVLFLFWACVSLILYTYLLFPALIFLRGLIWNRPYKNEELVPPPYVSVIIAAYNEEKAIGEKLDNILSADYPKDRLEVLLASDGSTDNTNAIVQSYQGSRVKLISLPRVGKAAALNAAVSASKGDILVFSDANSMYKANAIRALVKPFADPNVGGVAGDQRYMKINKENVGVGERIYWNFDRLLKQFESRAGNTISATGAIYAIRHSLFQPVQEGVTDDFFTSTAVIAQAYRLVFAPDAVAYEPVASTSSTEFGRKVRVITRGLSAVLNNSRSQLLNPFRYGFYAIQLFSHKVLRRLVVYPIVLLFFVTPFLWKTGLFYQIGTIGQLVFYSLAIFGLLLDGTRFRRLKIFSIPFYFCLVNVAALTASLNVLRRRQIKRWEPQREAESM